MGYPTVSTCAFSLDMPQTPKNVYNVCYLAGWTVGEAAEELGIDPRELKAAEDGFRQLPDSVWREFLQIAGCRAFDHDPE